MMSRGDEEWKKGRNEKKSKLEEEEEERWKQNIMRRIGGKRIQ